MSLKFCSAFGNPFGIALKSFPLSVPCVAGKFFRQGFFCPRLHVDHNFWIFKALCAQIWPNFSENILCVLFISPIFTRVQGFWLDIWIYEIFGLATSVKGVFFYLYLFLDVYSRKIVGWQVYECESSDWAAEIVRDIVCQEGISRDQVTLHSDNGGPMKGATMLATLQALGILPSFSRPAVSNDNPYSEALFKTLKYRPEYPAKPFADLNQARLWVTGFVAWYNHHHRHSAIQYVTPHQRHSGQEVTILQQRQQVYEAAKKRHPERWQGKTRSWDPVTVVYLNPERKGEIINDGRDKKAA